MNLASVAGLFWVSYQVLARIFEVLSRQPAVSVDGLLPIHKPHGMISKDVSRWLTRRFGRLKLGHVGTLDPAASGVLPILLGRATRLQDYLLGLNKSYEFDMTLGFETDTLDLDGVKIKEGPWEHVTALAMEAAGQELVGAIEQVPPLFSAVKYRGKALYDYARGGGAEGVPLTALKRQVTVYSMEFLGLTEGVGTFRVSCSKGTYIRSLVKEIAEKIGSCATLTRLVRTEAAGIALDDAVTLEEIEASGDPFAEFVIPLGQMKVELQRWQSLNAVITSRLRSGQEVLLEDCEYMVGTNLDKMPFLDEVAGPILLLDATGDVFGIGTKNRNMTGQIVMQMKRGL